MKYMGKHFQESSAIWALGLLENLTLMLFSNKKRYSLQAPGFIYRILDIVHFCGILALRNQISFLFIPLCEVFSQHIFVHSPFF